MRRSRYYRRRNQKKGKRSGRELRIGEGTTLHIKRTQAQMLISGGIGRPKVIVQALVLINELTPIGVLLFSEAQLEADQHITLNIPNLKNFFVKARVMSCKEIALSSGILSTGNPYKYRLQLKFEFGSEVERHAVEEYCQYLAHEYLEAA